MLRTRTHPRQQVLESGKVRALVDKGRLTVKCARYQIASGEVEFFE
jgi:hypothetical protein